MPYQIAPVPAHPQGEPLSPLSQAVQLTLDTPGKRFHVEWDPAAPVTPLGHLVFFSQFLAAGGLFGPWVAQCPLHYTSPNAPAVVDVLGTLTLGILAGQHRYAHLTALRADRVNPAGLGMSKVCSEDSARRAFAESDPLAVAAWQHQHLQACWEPALDQPWVLDIDTTIKPIYGHQEGATLGYNPFKPGRPSHAYHTYFVARLRLVLDVEVQAGNRHAAGHGLAGLWQLWERLKPSQRPELIRGDCAYGHEKAMTDCEERHQAYLFRLRQTAKVKALIQFMERQGHWQPAGGEWSALESTLRLSGWSTERRVVVLRRPLAAEHAQPGPRRLPLQAGELALEVVVSQDPTHEYCVLVTNTGYEPCALGDLYRQRADAENALDELKNQWGWGGFTTRDLLRCQVMARIMAQVYNWWNLFVRCAQPARPREAITSRPLLLWSVGRVVEHAHQSVLRLTSTHGDAAQAQRLLTGLSVFLSGLMNRAEQLTSPQRWQRIWDRILTPFRVAVAALPGPAG